MDAMESRLHRLNAMTRSEIIPARMLQASSVNELQTMRMNETAGKRLTRDIDALSRRELMEIGDVAAEQQRTRKDAARMKATRRGCDVDEWMGTFRRRAEREKEAERKRIRDKMVIVKRRASVLGLTSEEARQMASNPKMTDRDPTRNLDATSGAASGSKSVSDSPDMSEERRSDKSSSSPGPPSRDNSKKTVPSSRTHCRVTSRFPKIGGT